MTPRRAEPGNLTLDVPIAIKVQTEKPSGPRRRELSRRPKQLDTQPALFKSGGGDSLPAGGGPGRRKDSAAEKQGSGKSALVAHESRARDLKDLLEPVPLDPGVVTMARQIEASLSLRRRPQRERSENLGGPLASSPYRYRSDDIDLDRTLAVLAENPRPEDTDIIVRERSRSPRAAVLIIDVSGSMKGEKVRMAAATVGALAAEFGDDQLAVVAFWSDAAVVKTLDHAAPVANLLEQLLSIPTRGLTNVSFGLEVAAAEVAQSSARRRVAVLLTDALHNAGPDPRELAARFQELHVLAQVDGPHDLPLASEIAREGHGRIAAVGSHRDIASALNRLLGS